MTCSYHYKSEKGSPPIRCNFPFRQDEHISVNGKEWCPLHAPQSTASKWNQEQLDRINKRIFSILDQASRNQQTVDFTDAVFPGPITFSSLPKVLFHKTIFQDSASFSNITFQHSAWFPRVTFNQNVDFSNAIFLKGANFSETKFRNITNFSGATFKEGVSFYQAEFAGETKFTNTTFQQDGNFANAKFTTYFSDWTNARFEKAMFLQATFSQGVRFKHTLFKDFAQFRESLFENLADFSHATFEKDADFFGASFQDIAHFRKAIFHGRAEFNAPGTANTKPQLSPNTFQHVSFNCATFGADVSFTNRHFLQPGDFGDCTFTLAPEFHGCAIHQGITFPSRKFFKDVRTARAPGAYRTLKLAMEEARARQEEGMFFALEQESLCAQPTTPKSVKFMSNLYKWGANYGQSFVKPPIFLILITLAFFGLYLAILSYLTNSFSHAQVCWNFTTEQLVRPFSAWLSSEGSSMKVLLGPHTGMIIGFQVLATLQALLSLGLITLFILATRRRFKLG